MIEYNLSAPNIISFIIITFVLILNSYTDLKNKEIEFKSLILMVITVTFVNFMSNNVFVNGFDEVPFTNAIIGAVTGFGVFFILAALNKGGGGDAVLAGCLGWCVGAQISSVIIIANIIYIAFLLIVYFKKLNIKKERAFIPFMLLGWIITLIIYLIKNNMYIGV